MKRLAAAAMLLTISGLAMGAGGRSLAGTWRFDAEKSTNVGDTSPTALTVTITETGRFIRIRELRMSQGREQVHDVRYDTTAQPVANEGPMGEKATTVSVWSGTELITTWSIPVDAAGKRRAMTEQRGVSADGKTMSVEWRRGDARLMTLVFDRE